MSVTLRALDRLVAWLLPAACLSCAAALPGVPASPLGLCARCRRRLAPLPAGGCPLCGRPLPAPAGTRCGRCRERPPAFDRLLVAWPYRPPLDAVIRGLKFHRLDYLAAHLAAAMHGALGAELGTVDAVVPVPLHWRRRLARGYDQAGLIAEVLAARLSVPLVRGLRRVRPTAPQTALRRGRRLVNPRGAFRCRGGHVAGREVLLIDDVVTTGATLDAAARELRRGGAAGVVAAALARTPD